MRIGVRDRKVIDCFIHRRPCGGHKLSTDGRRLDGHWMGGHGIASWDEGSIAFHDLGSRSAQTVQRAVRKRAKALHRNPTFWIQDALRHHRRGALHRKAHVPMGRKIPARTLERLAHSRNLRTRRQAVLARTLRSFRHKRRR